MYKTALVFVVSIFLFVLSTNNVKAEIVINEVLPNPVGTDSGNEWVELYNTDSTPVVIDGYKLEDKNGNLFTLSGSIDKWLSVHPTGGNFAITNDGLVTVKLLSSSGIVLNEFTYNDSAESKSWGRIPDGGTIYTEKLTPTEGSSNQAPTPTPTNNPTPTSTTQATSSPTPIVTPKPTFVATKSPTPKPKTPTPSPTPEETLEPTREGETLGVGTTIVSPSPNVLVESSKKTKMPVFAIFLIGSGVIFLIVPFAWPFISKKLYNKTGYES